MRATAGASSHVGRIRQGNEDAYVAIDGLYVVADGMGGHSAGEVASSIAVTTLTEIFTSTQPGMTTPERVAEAISVANTAIFNESLDDAEKAGMGTTLTALVVTDPARHEVVIANIGDSRTYVWRNGVLQQITVDHSHVQALVERGAISPAEARNHYQRNIVLRALGIDSRIDIDLFPFKVMNGDRFILCSDGLVDEAEDAEIENEIRLRTNPQELADSLVDLANAHGGRDNITVLVVDFDIDPSVPIPPARPTTSGRADTTTRTQRPRLRRSTLVALTGAVAAVTALIITLVLAL